MARRRNRSSLDMPAAPIRRFPDPLGAALIKVHRLPSVRLLEDRRLFHPSRALRPALSFYHKAAKIVYRAKSSAVPSSRMTPMVSPRVGFAVPRDVAVCVRRKARKEVMHATGKAGGRVSRKRRRNLYSSVDC